MSRCHQKMSTFICDLGWKKVDTVIGNYASQVQIKHTAIKPTKINQFLKNFLPFQLETGIALGTTLDAKR